MKINMYSDNQLKNGCERIQACLYKKMNQASETKWIRGVAPFIELSTALLTIVARVCLVAENIIKGLGNFIFGFRHSDTKNLGLEQLFVGSFKNTILIPYSIAIGLSDFVVGSYRSISGKVQTHSLEQWHKYDPTEKEAYSQRIILEKRKEKERESIAQKEIVQKQKDDFLILFTASQENSPDPESLYKLALCYRDGSGVQSNPEKYIECLKQAADLEHQLAIELYRPIGEAQAKAAELQRQQAELQAKFQREKEEREAKQAQEINSFNEVKLEVEKDPSNADLIYELACCYRDGKGVQRNHVQYGVYLDSAAALGHLEASEIKQQIAEEQTRLKEAAEQREKEIKDRKDAEKTQFEDLRNKKKAACISESPDYKNILYQLAVCYQKGKGTEQSDWHYLEYLKKAAFALNETAIKELGNNRNLTVSDAQYMLSNLNMNGMFNRYQLSLPYLEKLAKNENIGAIEMVGYLYLRGEYGIHEDCSKALKMFELSKSIGSTAASRARAECFITCTKALADDKVPYLSSKELLSIWYLINTTPHNEKTMALEDEILNFDRVQSHFEY